VTFDTKTSATGTVRLRSRATRFLRLDVEATGFRTFNSTGNLVSIGQPATINVKLEVGAIADKVEVAGVGRGGADRHFRQLWQPCARAGRCKTFRSWARAAAIRWISSTCSPAW